MGDSMVHVLVNLFPISDFVSLVHVAWLCKMLNSVVYIIKLMLIISYNKVDTLDSVIFWLAIMVKFWE